MHALKRYREVTVGDVVTGERSAQALQWATHQAYLALGNFITSAALMGVDTCPMEGFEPKEYDKILELRPKNWRPSSAARQATACRRKKPPR